MRAYNHLTKEITYNRVKAKNTIKLIYYKWFYLLLTAMKMMEMKVTVIFTLLPRPRGLTMPLPWHCCLLMPYAHKCCTF